MAAYVLFMPSNSEQRLHPLSYRGCWHRVSRGLFIGYRHRTSISSCTYSSPIKGVYNPKAFILHAASLRQTFVHCGRFPTAASRRSQGRISVPMWGVTLSGPLPVRALVGRYPTNKLMVCRLLSLRAVMPFYLAVVCGITPPFGGLSPTKR